MINSTGRSWAGPEWASILEHYDGRWKRKARPTLESILGQGRAQDPSCSAEVRIVTIPRRHPLTVWLDVCLCHQTMGNSLFWETINLTYFTFTVCSVNCLTIVTTLSRFLLFSKCANFVLYPYKYVEGWWLRVTGCMQAQDLDQASLPSRGWAPEQPQQFRGCQGGSGLALPRLVVTRLTPASHTQH